MFHRVTSRLYPRCCAATPLELGEYFAVPVPTIQHDLQDLRQLSKTIDKDDIGRLQNQSSKPTRTTKPTTLNDV